MAVVNIVQEIMGVLLTYLELAVVLVLIYMIFRLLIGGTGDEGGGWNPFSRNNNTPNGNNGNNNGPNSGPNTTPTSEAQPATTDAAEDEAAEKALEPGTANWSEQARVRFIAVNMNNEPVEGVHVRVYAKPAGSSVLTRRKLVREGPTNQFGTVPMTTDGRNDWWVVPSGDLVYEYDMEPNERQLKRVMKQQARITNAFRLRNINPFFLWRYFQRDNAAWYSKLADLIRGAFSDDPFKGKFPLSIAHKEERVEPILLSFYSNQFPENFQPVITRANRITDNGERKLDLCGEIH